MRAALCLTQAGVISLGCSSYSALLASGSAADGTVEFQGVTARPAGVAQTVGLLRGGWVGPAAMRTRANVSYRRRTVIAAGNELANEMDVLARRIYDLVGREFDLGKPTNLSKVLYEEVQVDEPPTMALTWEKGKPRNGSSSKPNSTAALQILLDTQTDARKRELVKLVLKWVEIKAVLSRGGFRALGARVADMPEWQSSIIPDHEGLVIDPTASPLMLIDGHYLMLRSFHAMPPLMSPAGFPVGALVGFCNVINKLVVQPWVEDKQAPQRVLVVFDSKGQNFRHKLYPGYGSNRPRVPKDLKQQFGLVKRACKVYGLTVIEQDNFEADDVIASVALQAVKSGVGNVTVVSADKDLAQVVTSRVNLLNPYTGERLGPEEVLAKYLVPPGRVADMLSLVGDKANKIIGMESCGIVKASKLLANYSSLEEAIEELCESLKRRKASTNLIAQIRSKVQLARSVVRLRTDALGQTAAADILQGLKPYEMDDPYPLLNFLQQHGLKDLLRRTCRQVGLTDVVLETGVGGGVGL
ncbi:unnamed protein product, partial [Discosporangium mesarthrocarpum]